MYSEWSHPTSDAKRHVDSWIDTRMTLIPCNDSYWRLQALRTRWSSPGQHPKWSMWAPILGLSAPDFFYFMIGETHSRRRYPNISKPSPTKFQPTGHDSGLSSAWWNVTYQPTSQKLYHKLTGFFGLVLSSGKPTCVENPPSIDCLPVEPVEYADL